MARPQSGDTLVAIAIPALAFAVVPQLAAPFSTPKHWILMVAATAAVALVALAPRREIRFAVIAPVIAVGLIAAVSSLCGALSEPDTLGNLLGAVALTLAMAHLAVRPEGVVRTLSWTGGTLAAITIAQAVGVDPFHLLGSAPVLAGARMRVYATLGNPDFVAAWLVPCACATVATLRTGNAGHRGRKAAPTGRDTHLRGRETAPTGPGALLLLQVVALGLTRSYATVLAVLGASVVLLVTQRRNVRPLALAVVALLAIAAGLAGRPISSRISGRLYLTRVAAPHLLDSPWLGNGPGSLAELWPAWEAEHWESHADAADRVFAGPERHAHDDFLELALELGLPGALAMLAWIAVALVRGLRGAAADPDRLALTCALAALAARAVVDFPLARPAELGLFAVLTAALLPEPAPSAVETPCPVASDPSALPSV